MIFSWFCLLFFRGMKCYTLRALPFSQRAIYMRIRGHGPLPITYVLARICIRPFTLARNSTGTAVSAHIRSQHQRGVSGSRYLSRRYSGQADVADKPAVSMQAAIANMLQAAVCTRDLTELFAGGIGCWRWFL